MLVKSDSSADDYYGGALETLLQSPQNILTDKRSCIRRSGTCDHRPNDCCPKSVCNRVNTELLTFH
ncbi:unnamed protein product [Oppiella nova]|uniref:Uncharacterized protein n=1 Tax=Oppiella nova TaxID=334625 RepID=A0A7R9MCW5_9ACAR|nr:unnamed protein product [Oppiella nova]CAG2175044.1 unnamed protein product [Oppiella nova]